MKNKLDKKFEKVAEAIRANDYDSLYKDYKLAIAANHQLADKLAAKEKESDKLRLLLFAFVRNSRVAAIGYNLKKSEQEITDKTFETIKEAEKILDFAKMQELMNLASDKENRYDRE